MTDNTELAKKLAVRYVDLAAKLLLLKDATLWEYRIFTTNFYATDPTLVRSFEGRWIATVAPQFLPYENGIYRVTSASDSACSLPPPLRREVQKLFGVTIDAQPDRWQDFLRSLPEEYPDDDDFF